MQTTTPPTPGPLVLVVDDERNIRESIAVSLRREDLAVSTAEDGHEAISQARALKPDVIVLDVMLPGVDGFEVCRVIRRESNVPILLLSARSEAIDRVVGLEIGADDYLIKPFVMRELVARVRAMLRRARMYDGANTKDESLRSPNVSHGNGEAVHAGNIELDIPRREARLSGQPLTLRSREFDLLLYFARHPGIVLSRDALLREVWGYDYPMDTRTVDVHVRLLREKIEHDPSLPSRITTVRGHGYRFLASDS